jgi:hypothetical protein
MAAPARNEQHPEGFGGVFGVNRIGQKAEGEDKGGEKFHEKVV